MCDSHPRSIQIDPYLGEILTIRSVSRLSDVETHHDSQEDRSRESRRQQEHTSQVQSNAPSVNEQIFQKRAAPLLQPTRSTKQAPKATTSQIQPQTLQSRQEEQQEEEIEIPEPIDNDDPELLQSLYANFHAEKSPVEYLQHLKMVHKNHLKKIEVLYYHSKYPGNFVYKEIQDFKKKRVDRTASGNSANQKYSAKVNERRLGAKNLPVSDRSQQKYTIAKRKVHKNEDKIVVAKVELPIQTKRDTFLPNGKEEMTKEQVMQAIDALSKPKQNHLLVQEEDDDEDMIRPSLIARAKQLAADKALQEQHKLFEQQIRTSNETQKLQSNKKQQGDMDASRPKTSLGMQRPVVTKQSNKLGQSIDRPQSAPPVAKPNNLLRNEERMTIAKRRHLEYVQELKEKEEYDLNFKFKANPIPPSSLIPKFHSLMNRIQAKTAHFREQRLLQNQSREKHFHDQHKKQTSYNVTQKDLDELKKPFKANPVPTAILEKTVPLDPEERKRIIHQKAIDKLRQSSLPPRMSMDPHSASVNRTTDAKHAKLCRAKELPTHKPVILASVPDFKTLQQQFTNQLEQKRAKRARQLEVKTFQLHRTDTELLRQKILEDKEKDQSILKEYRWPYQLPRTKPQTAQYRPTAPVRSRRRNNIKKYQAKVTKNLVLAIQKRITQQKIEEEKKQMEEEERLQLTSRFYMTKEQLQAKIKPLLHLEEQSRKESLQRIKSAAAGQEDDYKNQLNMIYSKLVNRPLLLDQQEI